MKYLSYLALAVLCAIAIPVRAAAPPGWTEDYTKAVEKAKTENKNVLLDFTGSDWCGYCIALNKEVFSTAKFKAWAKDHVVLVEVDFPHSKPQTQKVKAQNADLKSKYPAGGYPTIVIVDTAGNELAKKVGYSPGSGPDAYIAALEGAMKK